MAYDVIIYDKRSLCDMTNHYKYTYMRRFICDMTSHPHVIPYDIHISIYIYIYGYIHINVRLDLHM